MTPAAPRIPVSRPDLSGNEAAYVADAIASSWISSTGPYLDRFEHEWAAACGAKHALAVSNGTVALHLALLGLDVRPGDEVIVPDLTFVATANAVRYVGAEPVLVDVDRATWTLDPALLEQAIGPRTKGIIAVHLYGHPADMDAINEIAALHGVWVVEDAAEAHFAKYKGRPVGSLAKVATFSFYGNKIITCGEGGAVTCSDDALAARMRLIRGQGQDPKRRYFHPIVGHNFRLGNVAAAILCAQLEHAEAMLRDRRRSAEHYAAWLADCVALQPVAEWASPVPWTLAVTSLERHCVESVLTADGIETRPFFVPLHELPPYRCCRRTLCPQATALWHTGLCLPMYPSLSDATIEEVSALVKRAVG